MVFPTSDDMKRDIHNTFESLTENFTFKKAASIFKEYQKYAMNLWEKLSILNNANPEDV